MHTDPIVARKYALALFKAALEKDRLDQVDGDLTSLAALMGQDPRFLAYLGSPREMPKDRQDLLERALAGRVDALTLRFLSLVLDKKRIDHLPGMIDKFHELVRHHRGIVLAEVRTAVPLDRDEQERFRVSLSRLTGKAVQLNSRVDTAILGGVVVAFEDQIIDRSVRRGLDDLRETLMKVRVL